MADWFHKRHANVLQSIDGLECSDDFTQLNFQSSTYTDGSGRSVRSMDMTKDGLVFPIMGFTGRQAASFKEAYIARFNAMEAELKDRHAVELAALRSREAFLTADQYGASAVSGGKVKWRFISIRAHL